MPAKRESARIKRAASRPSNSGSCRSIRISAGRSSAAIATPLAPSGASRTSYPSAVRMSRTSSRFIGLSSTTRILGAPLISYLASITNQWRCGVRLDRQPNDEPAAAADLAVHADRPPLQLDEPARQRQAETGAFVPACMRTVDLLEFAKDAHL